MTQGSIPAVWMRGGTSKGLFFHQADLPADAAERNRLLLRLLGSPDPYGKQIDGLGGATSSTSKVVIIKPSARKDCDVDYWFGHAAISDAVMDESGNCGNLTAAVGPFAIDEGLVPTTGQLTRVRIWQSNIGKRIIAQVPTENGKAVHRGHFTMDGVPFPGAAIDLYFPDAGGLTDGSVLPTGNVVDDIHVGGDHFQATLVHAGNPAVFLQATDFGLTATETPEAMDAREDLLERLAMIRAEGAVMMGLASTVGEACSRPATPKIHWVGKPATHALANGRVLQAGDYDLSARALSMGRAHHAYPGTSAIATAVAAAIPGSVVARCSHARSAELCIGHASGRMTISAQMENRNGLWMADSVRLQRSARRLMQGEVLLP